MKTCQCSDDLENTKLEDLCPMCQIKKMAELQFDFEQAIDEMDEPKSGEENGSQSLKD